MSRLNHSICKSTLPGIIGIGGDITPVIGEIYVKVQMGNLLSAKHRVVIVDGDGGVVFPFILGIDFLDSYRMSIDTNLRALRRECLTGNDILIPLQTSTSIDGVVTQERLVIPARTVQLLNVKVIVPDGTSGVVELLHKGFQPVLVARSLNVVQKESTVLELANVTNEPCVIAAGRELAKFEPMCEIFTGMFPNSNLETTAQFSCVELFDLTETDLMES